MFPPLTFLMIATWLSYLTLYHVIAQDRSRISHKEQLHKGPCPPSVWMPPIRHRADLGDVLKQMGAKKGFCLRVKVRTKVKSFCS